MNDNSVTHVDAAPRRKVWQHIAALAEDMVEPFAVRLYVEHPSANLDFESVEAATAWAERFGAIAEPPRPHPTLPIIMHRWYLYRGPYGWHWNISANEPKPPEADAAIAEPSAVDGAS